MSHMTRIPLTVEQALLGFLRERPMHGYEIHQRLSRPAELGVVWRLKPGQLYALLDRLEEEGYIAATVEPQEGRPPRKVFCLTEKGAATFAAWVESPVARGREFRLEFLAKLYFARREPPAVLARLVERQRAQCAQWLAEQQRQAEQAQATDPYEWLVCRFRSGQIEAMLAWLEVVASQGESASQRVNESTKM